MDIFPFERIESPLEDIARFLTETHIDTGHERYLAYTAEIDGDFQSIFLEIVLSLLAIFSYF
jgi:hypothetical protein